MTTGPSKSPDTPPNIREALGPDWRYSKFNREERNVAAILYHLLLTGGNLAKFCDLVGADLDRDPTDIELYVEFAYLRDLWHELGERSHGELSAANDVRRKLILDTLRPSAEASLRDASVLDFNQYFGAARPSAEYIQSPGRWTVMRLTKALADDEEFMRTCRYKWAFNIKPDLVVIDRAGKALCVEAKVESEEGSYPASEIERAEFDRRFPVGQRRVGQLDLQRQLMREMLGFDTTFVFLVRDLLHGQKTEDCITLSWDKAFDALDVSSCQPYMREWIERL